eukprot:1148394-Pelagomonas_calceolata.AAC.1
MPTACFACSGAGNAYRNEALTACFTCPAAYSASVRTSMISGFGSVSLQEATCYLLFTTSSVFTAIISSSRQFSPLQSE